ncbi:hypothetical protein BuS5_04022 (plasmid) [Desulfosarcina sp. BuS5]|uniref:hypothetical protein n=1 Tax=Desulfosarcina sp. BuS5 TaxID=933262 RepID=UPI0012F99DFA|nr:hypothetical protein [Desulfosarcina sp. BuS5]WDN91050.1 hypothetical protein BuS5_04022 [Desulfosarcina sp. BuS5]
MDKENRKNNGIVNLGQPVTAGMDIEVLEKTGDKLVKALRPFLAMLQNERGTNHARN